MAGTAARRGPSRVISFFILAAAGLLLYVALPNLGPALRVATADGTPGTFTAQRLDCVTHPGHESCSWLGRFRPRDGSGQLRAVALSGARKDQLRTGQRVPAVDLDVPGRVYAPGRSFDWIVTMLLLIGGYFLLAVFAKRHLMPPPRPRGSPHPVEAPAPHARP